MGDVSKKSIQDKYMLVQPISFNRHLLWLWSQSIEFKVILLETPRNLLEMQFSSPTLRPTESEIQEVRPSNLCFNKPSK